eukprot:1721643-Pleurochrysis_carterae.AAC.1
MLDEIRAFIRAREAARSSGRAFSRVSDPHSWVEHHQTPHRASGSRVSTVSKPSGPSTVNTPTQRDPFGEVSPLGSLRMRDDAHSGLLASVHMHPDPRITRRHTS